ncbi:MAG: hypothetical protein JWP03_4901, partial [Phycisphaerales bacterium]|nr:hypothetical protein [Phycisphaerales bacterium]
MRGEREYWCVFSNSKKSRAFDLMTFSAFFLCAS